MKKIFLNSFILLLSFFPFASPIMAQNSGLSISPPVTQLLLSPNKKITQSFTVTNLGESGDFVASFHLAKPVGNNGNALVDPAPLELDRIPIIPRLENADLALGKPFRLDRNQSQQLIISLEGSSIKDTEDTYLALVIKAVSPEGQFSQTTPGISALILTTLTGDNQLPVKIDLEDFTVPAFHDSFTPLAINATLVNSSSIMIRPEGKLKLLNFQGKETYQTSLYNNLILSMSKRIIQGKNDQNQPVPLIVKPQSYFFGPHRIVLTISTIGGSKILEVERMVWFIPIRSLIISLLAILLTILLLLLRKRKFQDHRIAH